MSRHNRERRERNRAATADPRQRGELLPGRAYILTVCHDDACALIRGAGPCDCTPEVGPPVLVPAPDDN